MVNPGERGTPRLVGHARGFGARGVSSLPGLFRTALLAARGRLRNVRAPRCPFQRPRPRGQVQKPGAGVTQKTIATIAILRENSDPGGSGVYCV